MSHIDKKIHIALIMDGNGRWAQNRYLPRMAGHRAGLSAARKIIAYCGKKKEIAALTLFAFSSENWKRPKKEVLGLMELFYSSLEKESDLLLEHRIKLRVWGDRRGLNTSLQEMIERVEALTQHGDGLQLNIAINYGGRWDIVQAAQRMSQQVAEGHLQINDINEELMEQFLCTAGTSDPDLLIRTSGEVRLSNFVLWQCVYSELYFTPVLWPDFTEQDLEAAILEYSKRKRRYGAAPLGHSESLIDETA